eukprot:m.154334 g.154334  ORF g.154334 m.154334 type:complete len:914 (+) comp15081_c0_seq2:221-2962(+)
MLNIKAFGPKVNKGTMGKDDKNAPFLPGQGRMGCVAHAAWFSSNALGTSVTVMTGKWEVPPGDLDENKTEALGTGPFGRVYKASVQPKNKKKFSVVVKRLLKSASKDAAREFMNETAILKELECDNVLSLIGVSSSFGSEESDLAMVLEASGVGDLKEYLVAAKASMDARPKTAQIYEVAAKKTDLIVEPKDQINFCGDIATGMAYLAEQGIILRDLAARNCIVSENKTVKVGDYGLRWEKYAEDYGTLKSASNSLHFPVRWLAPELFKAYTAVNEKTDVWSFGVTCWEVFSLGAVPYAAIEKSDVEVFVTKGGTLDTSNSGNIHSSPCLPHSNEIDFVDHVPILAEIITTSTSRDASKRMTFAEMKEKLRLANPDLVRRRSTPKKYYAPAQRRGNQQDLYAVPSQLDDPVPGSNIMKTEGKEGVVKPLDEALYEGLTEPKKEGTYGLVADRKNSGSENTFRAKSNSNVSTIPKFVLDSVKDSAVSMPPVMQHRGSNASAMSGYGEVQQASATMQPINSYEYRNAADGEATYSSPIPLGEGDGEAEGNYCTPVMGGRKDSTPEPAVPSRPSLAAFKLAEQQRMLQQKNGTLDQLPEEIYEEPTEAEELYEEPNINGMRAEPMYDLGSEIDPKERIEQDSNYVLPNNALQHATQKMYETDGPSAGLVPAPQFQTHPVLSQKPPNLFDPTIPNQARADPSAPKPTQSSKDEDGNAMLAHLYPNKPEEESYEVPEMVTVQTKDPVQSTTLDMKDKDPDDLTDKELMKYPKMSPDLEVYQESRSIWSKVRCAESKLKEASKKGFFRRVEGILQNNPNVRVNATREGGSAKTPLHCATLGGFKKITEMLLLAHADPYVKDKDGNMPLFYAREKGFRSIMALLRAAMIAKIKGTPIDDALAALDEKASSEKPPGDQKEN